jgi:peptidoglycan/xylan/chitin deacetylase (PgdA/CDA1 family)/SAM-dependent methyltransferase
MAHFYAKHRVAVQRNGSELILAKEAFNESQRAYRGTLETRAAALDAELAQLRSEIDAAVKLLAARGHTRVEWGGLAGTAPLSPRWGRDRGTPLDRYYVERFIAAHQQDIRGRVLEIREPIYTERFGGERVVSSDVVDRDEGNPRATIVADLRDARGIADASFDCIILTQTLQLVDDVPAVLRECTRMLKPGGTLLATLPSVIRVDDEAGRDGDFWRFTEASARILFASVFPVDAFEVTPYGNVKACAAFLYGVSVEEMTRADLDVIDPQFPLGVAIRAVRPAVVSTSIARPGHECRRSSEPRVRSSSSSIAANRGVIVCYHRIAAFSPDSHALCTPLELFGEHIAYLRDHCTPIALDDLVQAAAAGAIPERAVAVTFDDGYVDALTTASPILIESGVPATFFVNSDRLDEEHERWWDILERVFQGQQAVPPRLLMRAGSQDVQLATTTATERAAALEALSGAAWPLGAIARGQLVADVLGWSGAAAAARASHRVMTAGEIRTLAAAPGHSIGAHTVNHLALTCHDAETKRREIADDKVALARVVGRPVELFSYPYGELDGGTVAAVRDAGFRAAVTAEAGAVLSGTNRLLLPRVEVTRDVSRRFAQRLDELFAAPSRSAIVALTP